ncbi:LaeA-like methyltransferase [Penicillium odoratum]|uniref:LaeA-like methyltransferase n=1 Tax=Penicillium odoratum TaxID=1167516 RepID=UPI002546A038|nr:LaeA-like methyltransferase [Penicillium odoratum]KAJ5777173.1 LaeA-like methyltransferase [Penicillium odoratum]
MSTSTSEDSAYILYHRSKQAVEHERLNRQHRLIQQTFMDNQLIHPSISLASLRGGIADVGCGTGIWLEEVAHMLSHPNPQDDSTGNSCSSSIGPMPQLIGFDLNAAAFPESPAAGIQLVQHDCTQPFDAHYVGKFDLVNIRGLAYAVTEEKLGRVLENVSLLLKPGGYMQWTESEARLFKFFPETPDTLRAMQIIDDERRARELVAYLPHFMLQQILSLKGGNEEQVLNILHFNLRPGGFCQSSADPEVSHQFSEILTESINLFLQSALMRKEQQYESQKHDKAESDENKAHGQDELDQLTKVKESISDTIAAGTVKMGGIFPHLVAQKNDC